MHLLDLNFPLAQDTNRTGLTLEKWEALSFEEDENMQIISFEKTLTGGNVLPGFEVNLSELLVE